MHFYDDIQDGKGGYGRYERGIPLLQPRIEDTSCSLWVRPSYNTMGLSCTHLRSYSLWLLSSGCGVWMSSRIKWWCDLRVVYVWRLSRVMWIWNLEVSSFNVAFVLLTHSFFLLCGCVVHVVCVQVSVFFSVSKVLELPLSSDLEHWS